MCALLAYSCYKVGEVGFRGGIDSTIFLGMLADCWRNIDKKWFGDEAAILTKQLTEFEHKVEWVNIDAVYFDDICFRKFLVRVEVCNSHWVDKTKDLTSLTCLELLIDSLYYRLIVDLV